MKFKSLRARYLVLLLCILASLSFAHAQTQDASLRAKRQQALQLFDQGKRLEALPLLEELAKKNSADEEVVVALAASLVSHAATLTDRQAADKDRLRAKDLLEKSGSTTTLAQNLLQLLRAMPDTGTIQFSENPAVEQAMRAGEAAFSRQNFDEAIADYSRALELEPKNYTATLFIGNAFHRRNDFAKAREWYEKAIQLDPNTETAYRYYAHMLVKEGDMARARVMLIHAAVAEPYNRMVWRDLIAWASINDTQLNFAYAATPDSNKDQSDIGKKDGAGLDFLQPSIFLAPKPAPKGLANAWQAYRAVREAWKQGKFKQRFPQESAYRHSLAEESEALAAAIEVLERLRRNLDTAELVTEDQPVLLLLGLSEAGVLEPYVLFRLGDEGIVKDYAAYRNDHRDKLEAYMDKFVVPPAPKRAESAGEPPRQNREQSAGTARSAKTQVSK
jgi:Flp pilus assembly protein TadD